MVRPKDRGAVQSRTTNWDTEGGPDAVIGPAPFVPRSETIRLRLITAELLTTRAAFEPTLRLRTASMHHRFEAGAAATLYRHSGPSSIQGVCCRMGRAGRATSGAERAFGEAPVLASREPCRYTLRSFMNSNRKGQRYSWMNASSDWRHGGIMFEQSVQSNDLEIRVF